jgi:hypothetical protein
MRVESHRRAKRSEDILPSVHLLCRQQRVQVIEMLTDQFRELL